MEPKTSSHQEHILPSREALGKPCYHWGQALVQSILLYSSQSTNGKDTTTLLQQMGGLAEQDPCHGFPPYSEQPFPGQCAAACHPCAWARGSWDTDCIPRRWRMVLAPLSSTRTEHCNGIAPKIAAHVFPSSTLWTSLHTPCRDASNYTHSLCLRIHKTSRSYSPSSAQPGFRWAWFFPIYRIRQ